MMLRHDWDDLADNGQKGDWYFHMSRNDLFITIRYGDETMEVVTIPLDGPNSWTWDGNKEKPTISPSILVKGRSGGPDLWLQNGKVITAE